MEIKGDKAWASMVTISLDNSTVYDLGEVSIPIVKIDGKWKISLPD